MEGTAWYTDSRTDIEYFRFFARRVGVADYRSSELVATDMWEGFWKSGHLPFSEDMVCVTVGSRVHFDEDIVRLQRDRQRYGTQLIGLFVCFKILSLHCVRKATRHDDLREKS
jgi:hypothetical protein